LALYENPGWGGDAASLARFTLIWDACQDDGCAEDLDGSAFVRVVDTHGESIGRVVVCIADEICGDQEVHMGFP
jgi:hypothetical protein